MRPVEKFLERNEVAERFAHLLPVDCNHVVVHPVAHRLMAVVSHRLRDFALMVREHKIHSTAVDVERLAQIFLPHRRAFEMPSWESVAPWRRPSHDVFWRRFLPQREVDRVVLLRLSVERTRRVEQLVDVSSRQFAVVEVLAVLHHVEIYRTVAFVGISSL